MIKELLIFGLIILFFFIIFIVGTLVGWNLAKEDEKVNEYEKFIDKDD